VGSLRRKTFTKPLPEGAETIRRKGELLTRWKDAKGKTRTAPIAKYRDGDDKVVEVPTNCTDRQAAEQVLRDLEKQAERVRCGVGTTAEQKAISRQESTVAEHLEAYRRDMVANDRDERYIANTIGQLTRLCADCGFRLMPELKPEAVVGWLERARERGLSARTRNSYRVDLVTFAKWCVENDRLPQNPFTKLPTADQRADVRRQRRALTEDELMRLLDAARRRPLVDNATVRRGKDKGKPIANLRPETRERLERLGRERLPDLPLDRGTPTGEGEAGQATGTDDPGMGSLPLASSLLPPLLPRVSGNLCKRVSTADNNPEPDVELPKREKPANSQGKRGFSGVSGKGWLKGLEPSTLRATI
jgi:hypothetical protein